MSAIDPRVLLQEHVVNVLDNHLRALATERTKREFKIGAWNVGHCARKLWLGLAGTAPEPMQPRALMVFAAGNATEDWLIDFLIGSGIPLIRTNEKRDGTHLEPIGNVRPDLILTAGGVTMIPDVKSMSDFAFERAQAGKVEFSYSAQLQCYLQAYGEEWGPLFCVRKETSHLDLTTNVVRKDDSEWAKVKANHALAVASKIPDRPYKLQSACEGIADGKCVDGLTPAKKQPHTACGGTGKIPGGPYIPNFPCGYCEFKSACWESEGGKLLPVLAPGDKPRFRLA